jgi:hypothetical protein
MATLNVQHTVLSFDDDKAAGNPIRRFIDWTRRALGIAVENPLDDGYTIPAGASKTIFDGTYATAIDGTTAFSVSKVAGKTNTYRFTSTGGTSPGFRTDRAINLSGLTITMAPNGDGTLTLSVSAGTPLAAVQIRDTVFIPGVSTGDAGLFSPANEGAWTVLVNGGASLVLGRPGAYSGYAESVPVASAPQVLAFSSDSVQIGDSVDITAGFAPVILGTYTISQVTPKYFEVTSAKGVPAQAGITPTAAGMKFYAGLKRWVRVEVDQDAVVRFNGDTTNLNRVSPVAPGDKEQTGWLDKFGPVYSLVIVNRASVAMKALVQTAE